MSATEHERLLLEVRKHQCEISALSSKLSPLDSDAAVDARAQAVFVNAQVMRRRIALALLQSRLEGAHGAQG